MNNKLNYNILIDLSKSLVTGLFPYVFINKIPQPLYNNYSYSSNLFNDNIDLPKANSSRKKVLYTLMGDIFNNSLYYLDYKISNYSTTAYFGRRNDQRTKEILKSSNKKKNPQTKLNSRSKLRRQTRNEKNAKNINKAINFFNNHKDKVSKVLVKNNKSKNYNSYSKRTVRNFSLN